MRLIRLIIDLIFIYIDDINLKIKKILVKRSEQRILYFKNKLQKEEIYYSKLIKDTIKWCKDMQKNK